MLLCTTQSDYIVDFYVLFCHRRTMGCISVYCNLCRPRFIRVSMKGRYLSVLYCSFIVNFCGPEIRRFFYIYGDNTTQFIVHVVLCCTMYTLTRFNAQCVQTWASENYNHYEIQQTSQAPNTYRGAMRILAFLD